MATLTDHTTYADAQRHCSPAAALGALRRRPRSAEHRARVHRPARRPDRVAVRLVHSPTGATTRPHLRPSSPEGPPASPTGWPRAASGRATAWRSCWSRRSPFYAGLFGAMKRGAIAVPLFTLFGPDGLRLRVDDCAPRLCSSPAPRRRRPRATCAGLDVVRRRRRLPRRARARTRSATRRDTRADDLAVFQYTSGTTRELPEAVRHTHRSIVTLMVAALYGTGIRPGDRFFCPSSPAWGHGLWHGTLGAAGAGRHHGHHGGQVRRRRACCAPSTTTTITNSVGGGDALPHDEARPARARATATRSASSRSPASPWTAPRAPSWRTTFGAPVCSMYGTTEVGVILADYPGAPDTRCKPGALGKPVPGVRVEVQGPDGTPLPARTRWARSRSGAAAAGFRRKDRGWIDADGYFFHAGRADDVIISAGWTMSAVEIEDVLLEHADVREAAVIGVPDPLRGQVVKAFIVSARAGDDAFARELQDWTRTRLSPARVPAPGRVRGRAAQDARRQGQPQGAPRSRGRAPPCAPPRRANMAPETQPLLSQDHRAGPRRPAPAHRRADHRHARAVVPRGHARQHPPLRPRHRRRQPALVRSGLRRAARATAGSWRRRAFSSRRAGSSRATWAGSRACTRCGRARTGRGTGRCGATTRSRPRRGSRT